METKNPEELGNEVSGNESSKSTELPLTLEMYKVPEYFSAEQLKAARIVLKNFIGFNEENLKNAKTGEVFVEASSLISSLYLQELQLRAVRLSE